MSGQRRNPGREAGHCQAGRQAGEQASPHHGDPRGQAWAPKAVAALTPGPATLTRSNASPSDPAGRHRTGHRNSTPPDSDRMHAKPAAGTSAAVTRFR
jgi:hypothetical protein